MSVPRPTPTMCARRFQIVGNRIESTARPAKTSRASRRTAWVRAPRPRSRRTATARTTTIRTTWIRTIFMAAAPDVPAAWSSEDQLGKDVDGVPQGLPLRAGVVGVEDVNRGLGVRHVQRADLGTELRGVGHAVLGDVQPGDDVAVHRP